MNFGLFTCSCARGRTRLPKFLIRSPYGNKEGTLITANTASQRRQRPRAAEELDWHHCDTMYLREALEPMATTMVHVRVDEKTKEKAAKTLAGMGISVSDAVRMLLVRVAAEKALPFEVRVPNATTVKAMRAADRAKGKRHRSANALLEELGI